MVNLHYENLPELDISPDLLMRKAYYELIPYYKYLQISRNWIWVENRLKKVRWQPALVRNSSKNNSLT